MKKDFKKLACTGREIEWLKRDRPDYYAQGIKRLESGEPVDYVIGWKEFLGCKIDLSFKPLIPREETEFWVETVINELKQREMEARPPSVLACLDIFAGSGCIGLAILKHIPGVQMTFADKEEKYLKQVKKNLKLNGLKGKVVKTNVFSNVEGKFDIIFANPPYAATSKMKLISPSVLKWEPKKAVLGGVDGLTFTKKFLKEAKSHLNYPSTLLGTSKIYLEFGYGQKKAIENLLKQNKYEAWEFRKDQFGRFRLVVIQ